MPRVVFVVWLAAILGLASHPAAQSRANPAFEVVSIRPSNAATGPLGTPSLPTIVPPVGGRFTALNVSLRFLIGIAYDLRDFQIDGGPDWQTSRRFDIQATAKEPVTGMEAAVPMLKTLLADRFKLKAHTDTRQLPIYALVVARDDGKLGAGITRSTADCSTSRVTGQELAEAVGRQGPTALTDRLQSGRGLPCTIMPVPAPGAAGAMTMRGNGQSMAALAQFLTSATGRIVQDRTELSGLFDWELTFKRPGMQRVQSTGVNLPQATASAPSDIPSLMVALQERLGLKLESTRGPVDVLVIDSATLPEPN